MHQVAAGASTGAEGSGHLLPSFRAAVCGQMDVLLGSAETAAQRRAFMHTHAHAACCWAPWRRRRTGKPSAATIFPHVSPCPLRTVPTYHPLHPPSPPNPSTFAPPRLPSRRWCAVRHGTLTVYTAEAPHQVLATFDLAECTLEHDDDGPITVLNAAATAAPAAAAAEAGAAERVTDRPGHQSASQGSNKAIMETDRKTVTKAAAETAVGIPLLEAEEDIEEVGSVGCFGKKKKKKSPPIRATPGADASPLKGAEKRRSDTGLQAAARLPDQSAEGSSVTAVKAASTKPSTAALASTAPTASVAAGAASTPPVSLPSLSTRAVIDFAGSSKPDKTKSRASVINEWMEQLLQAAAESKFSDSFRLCLHRDEPQAIGMPADTHANPIVLEGFLWLKQVHAGAASSEGNIHHEGRWQEVERARRAWRHAYMVLHNEGQLHIYDSEACNIHLTSVKLAHFSLDVLAPGTIVEDLVNGVVTSAATDAARAKSARSHQRTDHLHQGEQLVDHDHVFQLVEGRQLLLRSGTRHVVLTSPEAETCDDWLIALRIAQGALYQLLPILVQSRVMVHLPDGRVVDASIGPSTRANDVVTALCREHGLYNMSEYALHEVVCACPASPRGARRRRLPTDEGLLDVTLLGWEQELRKRYGMVAEAPAHLFALKLLKISSLNLTTPSKLESLLDFHQALTHVRDGLVSADDEVMDIVALALFVEEEMRKEDERPADVGSITRKWHWATTKTQTDKDRLSHARQNSLASSKQVQKWRLAKIGALANAPGGANARAAAARARAAAVRARAGDATSTATVVGAGVGGQGQEEEEEESVLPSLLEPSLEERLDSAQKEMGCSNTLEWSGAQSGAMSNLTMFNYPGAISNVPSDIGGIINRSAGQASSVGRNSSRGSVRASKADRQSAFDMRLNVGELTKSSMSSARLVQLLPAAWAATAKGSDVAEWEKRVVTAHAQLMKLEALDFATLNPLRRKVYQHTLETNSGQLSALAAMRIVADHVRLYPRCFAAEFLVQLWTPPNHTYPLTLSLGSVATQLLTAGSEETTSSEALLISAFPHDDLISWVSVEGMLVLSALLREGSGQQQQRRVKLHLMSMEAQLAATLFSRYSQQKLAILSQQEKQEALRRKQEEETKARRDKAAEAKARAEHGLLAKVSDARRSIVEDFLGSQPMTPAARSTMRSNQIERPGRMTTRREAGDSTERWRAIRQHVRDVEPAKLPEPSPSTRARYSDVQQKAAASRAGVVISEEELPAETASPLVC